MFLKRPFKPNNCKYRGMAYQVLDTVYVQRKSIISLQTQPPVGCPKIACPQATAVGHRNKWATLQAESEDARRQLKRSMAKVAALGRDREEREAKLRAKQVGIHPKNSYVQIFSASLALNL